MLKSASKYIYRLIGYLFSCDYFEGNASIGDRGSICSSGYCVLSAQRQCQGKLACHLPAVWLILRAYLWIPHWFVRSHGYADTADITLRHCPSQALGQIVGSFASDPAVVKCDIMLQLLDYMLSLCSLMCAYYPLLYDPPIPIVDLILHFSFSSDGVHYHV